MITEVTEVTENQGHIQPIRLSYIALPILVTDGTTVLEEPLTDHTEPFPYKFTPARLRELAERPSLWATIHPAKLFRSFYDHYKRDPEFTFNGSISAKEMRPGMGIGTVGAVVRTVGFKRSKAGTGNHGSSSRRRRMHYLMDLRGYLPDRRVPTLEEQYELALEVRDFCLEMGIGPKLNFAGIAAALARHPKFWPQPRKRVPEFINEKARPYLPGNHYDLFTETGRVYKHARYYDQRSAHHHAALCAPTPTSDTLRGKGFTKGDGRIWVTPDHPRWKEVLSEYGLFMARANIPAYTEGDERYVPHDLRIPGIRSVPIWSAELPWLEEMGIKLLGIEWALTGNEVDTGLQEYARWALEESAKRPHFKATLLCTYGLKAQRRGWSRQIKGYGQRTVRWDLESFKVAHGPIKDAEFHTHGSTNVVQRGIIEAYTRMLTLRYTSLFPKDVQLGLYGDAVIVEDVEGKNIVIPIEEPFREKGVLSNLEFLSATQFVSTEVKRLPGHKAGMRR